MLGAGALIMVLGVRRRHLQSIDLEAAPSRGGGVGEVAPRMSRA
jgi:hypothetical protein